MAVIKKIDVLSLSKIQGLLMLVFGLALGIFTLIAGFFVPEMVSDYRVLFMLPLAYGVMGVIMGAVTAALYNLISKYIGGLKIEIKK